MNKYYSEHKEYFKNYNREYYLNHKKEIKNKYLSFYCENQKARQFIKRMLGLIKKYERNNIRDLETRRLRYQKNKKFVILQNSLFRKYNVFIRLSEIKNNYARLKHE